MRQTTELSHLFSHAPRTHPIRNPSIYSYYKGELPRPSPNKQTMGMKIYTYYKTFNIHTYNI